MSKANTERCKAIREKMDRDNDRAMWINLLIWGTVILGIMVYQDWKTYCSGEIVKLKPSVTRSHRAR